MNYKQFNPSHIGLVVIDDLFTCLVNGLIYQGFPSLDESFVPNFPDEESNLYRL